MRVVKVTVPSLACSAQQPSAANSLTPQPRWVPHASHWFLLVGAHRCNPPVIFVLVLDVPQVGRRVLQLVEDVGGAQACAIHMSYFGQLERSQAHEAATCNALRLHIQPCRG